MFKRKNSDYKGDLKKGCNKDYNKERLNLVNWWQCC